MKIYISGPITGTDDYMERIAEAQRIEVCMKVDGVKIHEQGNFI